MSSIREKELLANLPSEELMTSLREFMTPVLTHLLEIRLRQVSVLAVRRILAAQSPVLTEMARGVSLKMRWTGRWSSASIGLSPTPASIIVRCSRGCTAWRSRLSPVIRDRTWWWRLTPSTSRNPTRRAWRVSRLC